MVGSCLDFKSIIPANRDHIPTLEMARKWPHLEKIANHLMPLSECDVGLLIGYNCPRALVPRDVVPAPEGSGPFGQKTDLGWGIVGMIDPNKIHDDDDEIGVSHRILTCEVPPQETFAENIVQVCCRTSVKEKILPHQVAKMMEVDFNDAKDGKMLSQEDMKFMKMR